MYTGLYWNSPSEQTSRCSRLRPAGILENRRWPKLIQSYKSGWMQQSGEDRQRVRIQQPASGCNDGTWSPASSRAGSVPTTVNACLVASRLAPMLIRLSRTFTALVHLNCLSNFRLGVVAEISSPLTPRSPLLFFFDPSFLRVRTSSKHFTWLREPGFEVCWLNNSRAR